ncbi:hypothetical protein KGM_207590 [Danaus plexippus plexippus]|uniref:Uncharacterized protein n=1 Tax=Danaus plexippus plexippus TaxID=278856 RepID=A0A212F0M4_DANPL|nr:hypothetical protein KGM_207590 [Danaus plexippus plexippus]
MKTASPTENDSCILKTVAQASPIEGCDSKVQAPDGHDMRNVVEDTEGMHSESCRPPPPRTPTGVQTSLYRIRVVVVGAGAGGVLVVEGGREGGVKNCHCGVSRAALQRSNSMPESGETPQRSQTEAAQPQDAEPPAPAPAPAPRSPSSASTCHTHALTHTQARHGLREDTATGRVFALHVGLRTRTARIIQNIRETDLLALGHQTTSVRGADRWVFSKHSIALA